MLSYTKLGSKFLYELENHIPSLVNPTCSNLIKCISECGDIRSIILYGNETMYLNALASLLLKNMFEKETIYKKKASFTYTTKSGVSHDIEYDYSDYHFEIELSEKYLGFVKNIVMNKNISNKPFVFIVQNVDTIQNNYKLLQTAFKHMLDAKNNCRFILLTKSLQSIDDAITSRSMIINASFPQSHMKSVFESIIERDIDIKEFEDKYNESGQSLFALLVYHEMGYEQPRVFKHLDALLTLMTKEKNELTLINTIREFVYKIYHVTMPLNVLSNYIISKTCNEQYILDIVKLCAECSTEMAQSSKDILVFEKLLFGVSKILRDPRNALSKNTRKKSVKAVLQDDVSKDVKVPKDTEITEVACAKESTPKKKVVKKKDVIKKVE